MIKQLTLFCTFAIFMLAVGGAVTPVWAHDECGPGGKGKHSETHPHCVGGTTTDGSLYDVWVSGALDLGSETVPHTGHDGVGNKESVSVNWDFLNMDLDFFRNYFNLYDNGNGDRCFGDLVPLADRQAVLFIGHDKTGELEAGYVFSGNGTDGTRIGYRLKLSTATHANGSTVLPGWRPTSGSTLTELFFDEWELYNKKDIACIGSGFFSQQSGFGLLTKISIKLQQD